MRMYAGDAIHLRIITCIRIPAAGIATLPDIMFIRDPLREADATRCRFFTNTPETAVLREDAMFPDTIHTIRDATGGVNATGAGL